MEGIVFGSTRTCIQMCRATSWALHMCFGCVCMRVLYMHVHAHEDKLQHVGHSMHRSEMKMSYLSLCDEGEIKDSYWLKVYCTCSYWNDNEDKIHRDALMSMGCGDQCMSICVFLYVCA